jgi:hypothetical protein
MGVYVLPGLRLAAAGRKRPVSPAGELLSFAWPKESNQRKGHPCRVGLRLPCAARRPGRGWNSPCRAQTASPFLPRSTALLGDPEGASSPAPGLGEPLAPRDGRTRGFSPSALPIWRLWAGKKRSLVRAPQQGTLCVPCQGELAERPRAVAKSGTRRAAMWGRLFFGYFLLAKQKKVTRPKAKQSLCTARSSEERAGRGEGAS